MSEQITVGAATLLASLVGGVGLVRWAVTPVREPRHRRPAGGPSRHRCPDLLPSEEVLCGPPSQWTDPWADTQAFGVVRTGFGWCEPCAETTAGVVTRNGFRCGEFHRHPAGGAHG